MVIIYQKDRVCQNKCKFASEIFFIRRTDRQSGSYEVNALKQKTSHKFVMNEALCPKKSRIENYLI